MGPRWTHEIGLSREQETICRLTRLSYRSLQSDGVNCIRDSLVSYLESGHRLTSQQHGFMKGRSCLTNLLQTFESWTRALDEGYGIGVI